nr:MAG TPA: hypothetical protein [Bacteriophage sp.]
MYTPPPLGANDQPATFHCAFYSRLDIHSSPPSHTPGPAAGGGGVRTLLFVFLNFLIKKIIRDFRYRKMKHLSCPEHFSRGKLSLVIQALAHRYSPQAQRFGILVLGA